VDFLDKVYKRSDAMVFRKIGQEYILVPIRQGVGDLESIYTLNETAALIWEFLDGRTRVREIRDKIIENYEVTPQEAEKDLAEHVRDLQRIQAISES
jgi:hypothetical protein